MEQLNPLSTGRCWFCRQTLDVCTCNQIKIKPQKNRVETPSTNKAEIPSRTDKNPDGDPETDQNNWIGPNHGNKPETNNAVPALKLRNKFSELQEMDTDTVPTANTAQDRGGNPKRNRPPPPIIMHGFFEDHKKIRAINRESRREKLYNQIHQKKHHDPH